MSVTEEILPPETLDAIWQQWLVQHNNYERDAHLRYLRARSYKREWRNQRFEDWLWGEGFSIFQKDKKRYLKYMGPKKKLTLFLLKYAS